jgi:hypothetical protein
MTIQDHNFPVEIQDIQTVSNLNIPNNLGRAVVRTDTNDVLAIHGKRYELISHDEVVSSIMNAVSLSSIADDYDCNIDLFNNGARLRGEILFNDLVAEPIADDHIKFRICFYNSYDGAWSVQLKADALRLWCLNGCTTADHVMHTYQRHTTKLDVDGFIAQIQNGVETFWDNQQMWADYSTTKITDLQALKLFEATLCYQKSSQTALENDTVNQKQRTILFGHWCDYQDKLGSNLWALYNAATHWSTHTNDYANPSNKRRERENMVANMLKSNQWEYLTR